MLIERASPIDVFAHSRRVGLSVAQEENNYTFTVMGFGSSIDGDEGSDAAVRLTLAPINTDDNVLHIGVSANHIKTNSERRGASDVRRLKYLVAANAARILAC